jgi:hypothetical protein
VYWNQSNLAFPIYINEPWALWLIIPLQIAYLYLAVRVMLQVLRADKLVPGWKLFWLAVIYGLPLIGPVSWLLSSHSPRRKYK